MSDPVRSAAVVGPGAIGLTALTALLDRGHDTVACARTSFDQVRYQGPDGERSHGVRVLTDPAQVSGPVDLVVLATKAHQVEGAAGWLRALAGYDTVVTVLQNGIDHRERVLPHVGGAAVVPAVVNLPAARGRPGEVEVEARSVLSVPDDPAGQRVADAFAGTMLEVTLVADWLTAAWMKLLVNSSLGIIGVLGQVPNGALADPEVADLATALIDEAAEVGRAEGADLAPDIAETLIRRIVGRTPNHVSSIVADRLAGRQSEWQARNQVIVDRAELHGISVPLNRAGTTLIRLGEPS